MSRTQQLLDEIARKGSTRESIAEVYAKGIADNLRWGSGYVDWRTVNRALLKRYTPSGLDYIKARGWKLWEWSRVRA